MEDTRSVLAELQAHIFPPVSVFSHYCCRCVRVCVQMNTGFRAARTEPSAGDADGASEPRKRKQGTAGLVHGEVSCVFDLTVGQ